MQQTTESNIVEIENQEDHKVGKLAKKNNWASRTEQWPALLQELADKKHVTTTTTNGSS